MPARPFSPVFDDVDICRAWVDEMLASPKDSQSTIDARVAAMFMTTTRTVARYRQRAMKKVASKPVLDIIKRRQRGRLEVGLRDRMERLKPSKAHVKAFTRYLDQCYPISRAYSAMVAECGPTASEATYRRMAKKLWQGSGLQ